MGKEMTLNVCEPVVSAEAKDPKQKGRQDKKQWERPTIEDVSGKIMAQPYIRFT